MELSRSRRVASVHIASLTCAASRAATDDREVERVREVILVRQEDGLAVLRVVDLPEIEEEIALLDSEPLASERSARTGPKVCDAVLNRDPELVFEHVVDRACEQRVGDVVTAARAA